jgi:hypothetical protein
MLEELVPGILDGDKWLLKAALASLYWPDGPLTLGRQGAYKHSCSFFVLSHKLHLLHWPSQNLKNISL